MTVYLHGNLLLLHLALGFRMRHLLVMIEKRQMGENHSANVTLEADVGDGVLRQQILVDQRVIVAKRLRDVALVVGELGHVDRGSGVILSRVRGDFVQHVDVRITKRGECVLILLRTVRLRILLFLHLHLVLLLLLLLLLLLWLLLVLDLVLLARYRVRVEHFYQ